MIWMRPTDNFQHTWEKISVSMNANPINAKTWPTINNSNMKINTPKKKIPKINFLTKITLGNNLLKTS